ncbi:MAG: hydrogenase expression/formation protein HypC [Pseudonocardiales bacterium]|jgi:hydrogenase expression/formation protein HypC|nr:hydrogenase expression/formation protein HypC [Pseudonocardiales bacterium]
MCLGLPGRIVSVDDDGKVGQVDVAGVIREIDLSLLPGPLAPGDHVLIHSGIALERMTPDQARNAGGPFSG